MTIRASRGVRLLVMAAMAWLGLALCAQAAHATYGKVTIVKINKGGNANDSFTFHPSVDPSQPDFSLKGGESKTFEVECNVDRPGYSCASFGYPTETVTEKATAGYELQSIKCVHTQGNGSYAGEPSSGALGRWRHDRLRLNHQPQGELLGMGEVLRHERSQAA